MANAPRGYAVQVLVTGETLIAERYEVGPVIGHGGMGDVRRARDQRLERDVAIKFLRPDLAARPDVRARFEAEARNAGRLNHPNVVTVYDTGEYEGIPYLVMEFLPGRTLRDELVDGPLPPGRAERLARDVLGALGAAHGMGIVHRDVTPANILLTDEGVAKLADFGISKATESLDDTLAGQVVGTPAYLPPERLHGAPATTQTDLYSLGVVLYEAVTGDRLFEGPTPVAVAQSVIHNDVPPILTRCPDVTPGLAVAIDSALQRDPDRRIASAAAMAAALDGPAETTVIPPQVEPTIAFDAMPARAEPNRRAWAIVGLVVAVGLLLLGVARGYGPETADMTTQTSTPATLKAPAADPPPTTISASVPVATQDQVTPGVSRAKTSGRDAKPNRRGKDR